jgi:hypothetical protein
MTIGAVWAALTGVGASSLFKYDANLGDGCAPGEMSLDRLMAHRESAMKAKTHAR